MNDARQPGAGASTGVALAWAAEALALVLDLSAGELRADSPLVDLGADSVARIQWADVVEERLATDGYVVRVQDGPLAGAITLGDLAQHLAAVTR